MISRRDAYYRLRNDGYHVDETFQSEGVFCLGWKYLADGKTYRTVFSDGSVVDSQQFTYRGTDMKSSTERHYAPGKKFPVVGS